MTYFLFNSSHFTLETSKQLGKHWIITARCWNESNQKIERHRVMNKWASEKDADDVINFEQIKEVRPISCVHKVKTPRYGLDFFLDNLVDYSSATIWRNKFEFSKKLQWFRCQKCAWEIRCVSCNKLHKKALVEYNERFLWEAKFIFSST